MITKGKKHEKHSKLKQVGFGKFARHELSIMGSPGEDIRVLIQRMISENSSRFQIGFLDADDKYFKEYYTPLIISNGATKAILFKQSIEEVSEKSTDNRFDKYIANNKLDVLLVNGNHFEASTQIIVADERKRDSLERHVDRLNNIHAIFLPENVSSVPDWLKNLIPDDQNYSVLSDMDQLSEWFGSYLRTIRAPLKGLVLTGGKSTRMGEDKSVLKYYDQPQYEYIADLVAPFCEEVFLSVRQNQKMESKFRQISDRFIDLGPYGGILSAFMSDPESAWLVVAVDLPLLDTAEVSHLIQNRHTGKLATAFHNKDTGFPDPLCTIWEPRSYQRLLNFLAIGHSCPRKVLINSDIEEINPLHADSLKNVNTQKERNLVLKQLQQLTK